MLIEANHFLVCPFQETPLNLEDDFVLEDGIGFRVVGMSLTSMLAEFAGIARLTFAIG